MRTLLALTTAATTAAAGLALAGLPAASAAAASAASPSGGSAGSPSGGSAGVSSGTAGTSSGSGAVPMVFTSDRDGDHEIYTVDARGRATQLTRNRAHDFSAVWSPDGSRIAFVSDRDGDDEVFVMKADGSGVRQLTRNSRTAAGAPAQDQAPAWSPDGRRLAFASTRDGGEPEIYVMQADGSRQTRLTRTARHVSDHTPAWSPDGRWIAFASDRLRYDNYELFRMRPDGRDVVRLTRSEGDDNAPHYSPDGRRIVFSSNRTGQQDLHVMNADGTGTRWLAGAPDKDDVFPRWTPDGKRVVFWTFPGETGNADIWVVGADGKDRRKLTTSPAMDSSPDATPVRRTR
jgi:Tol biopolymer transport system component